MQEYNDKIVQKKLNCEKILVTEKYCVLFIGNFHSYNENSKV